MRNPNLLLVFILFLFCGIQLPAQTYYFSHSVEAYEDLNTNEEVLITDGDYWDSFTLFVIPFTVDFSYFGQRYDSLYIVSGGVSFTIKRNPTFTDLSGQEIGILATFIDVRIREFGGPGSPISYLVEGEEGAQIFKLQWKNAGLEEDQTEDDFINMQLWLYEEDGTIEMRFGPNSVTNPDVFFPNTSGPNVGIYDLLPTQGYFLVGDPANPTLVTTVPFPALNAVPADGTLYRFSLMPVALAELDTQSALKVYPNPFSDELWIEIDQEDQETHLQVTDFNGRLIHQQTVTAASRKVDLSALATGIYTLRIEQANGTQVRKIMKR